MHWRQICASIGAGVFLSTLAWAAPAKLSSGDKAFLRTAADSDMTEAHVGQMAEQQASESKVKDFGQTLVRDQTNAYQELTELANKVGATIPRGIDVRKDRAIGALAQAKGNKFDQQFVRDEVREHEKALTEFRHEAKLGHDADVKAYASKMLPMVEEQLRNAESLAKAKKHGS